MSAFVDGIMKARAYAKAKPNPLLGDDPDDIAEAWNSVRDWAEIKSGGQLTCRQLDLVADAAIHVWEKQR
jgi:hypothetical protein